MRASCTGRILCWDWRDRGPVIATPTLEGHVSLVKGDVHTFARYRFLGESTLDVALGLGLQ